MPQKEPRADRIIKSLNRFRYPNPIFLNYQNVRDFLFLPREFSAREHWLKENIAVGATTAAAFLAAVWIAGWITGIPALTVVSALVAFFYFGLMLFKLYVVYQSLDAPMISIPADAVRSLANAELPVYTILIPLYREEKVIPQILEAMSAIDYPPEKLDVIITLEEYDRETYQAIREANAPEHFKVLILPNVSPKTKPKALNVAFLRMRGEFVVIYDAEIIPDPDQLKKSVLAFREHPEIGCLQTRLDHYNTGRNFITKMFNAEFSFHYDLFLPGLQRLGLPIPLSGHSTHFRSTLLEDIGAWDPYNVTEDCDLGIRLYRMGYRTAILDSMSREEATSELGAWIRQRTRWMKGFIQTSMVHLRHPIQLAQEFGSWKNFFAFLVIVPATVLVNILNLFYWILLAAWIVFHPKIIQSFFPGPILYLSVTSFILGNLIFTYLNLLGVYGRGRFSIVKYGVFSPVYWIMLAAATVRAAIQFVVNPHHWEKTTHGTHLSPVGNTGRPRD